MDWNQVIEGTFKQELSNRFRCVVNIAGEDVICYLPSSCKLGQFISLSGRMVLLLPVKKQKTDIRYSIFAVKYRNSYTLLNLASANRVIETQLKRKLFSFLGSRSSILREHMIAGYKSDLYIADTDTIIEVKTVLSTEATAMFPTVYSERTLNQLLQLQKLLKAGYKVSFFIVSLCPYNKEILIDKETKFYSEFLKCVKLGMHASAYACRLSKHGIVISTELSLIQ